MVRKLDDAILVYEAGEDSLLAFTSLILELLRDRIVSVESSHYILAYAGDFSLQPSEVLKLRATLGPAGRVPLSGESISYDL